MNSSAESLIRYRTEDSPAPGELVRLQGFLNTWSGELDIEDLPTPGVTERWLRAASLWAGDQRVTRASHQQILQIRECLRQGVRQADSSAALEALSTSVSYRITFDNAGTPRLQPLGQGCKQLSGRLMAIVYDSMVDGSWSRFKCCALDSCGWAFYDSTRSRTRRWCSMKSCGSRHKARRYYERHR